MSMGRTQTLKGGLYCPLRFCADIVRADNLDGGDWRRGRFLDRLLCGLLRLWYNWPDWWRRGFERMSLHVWGK